MCAVHGISCTHRRAHENQRVARAHRYRGAVSAAALDHPASTMRRVWWLGTLGVSVAAFGTGIALAPTLGASPDRALGLLLVVGSAMHVASTGWFFSLAPVRRFAREESARYVLTPAVLIGGSAVLAILVPPDQFEWLLLGYFAWQFFHFQKQNLGLAALAGVSHGASSLRPVERAALLTTGGAGIVALVAHPDLLQLSIDHGGRALFPVAAAMYAVGAAVGVGALTRRPPTDRPMAFAALYLLGLAFFLPVFVFTSPYAAVAGLTMAHGFQYLLIVGLMAGGEPRGPHRIVSIAVFVNVALIGGIVLSTTSHLHDAAVPWRGLFGAYLGVVMAHFVIDGGLWRLRDEFPRFLLSARVPFLVRPRATTADATSAADQPE